ncbi:MAG: class I SAM-dependent methyltransferase [Bacteroidetes bacterium]|nr:MAG: class I SAM-dependent methyltransferase [Bacteroidota bacterium]
MTTTRDQRICPVELAGALDTNLRRWLQNPRKLLAPFIKPGMNILDIGCGPGFFTREMALMTGSEGHVVAADLQEGMLSKVAEKIHDTELNTRITLHVCRQDRIGLVDTFDFILAFYMVHEVPDKTPFLEELYSLLKPGGRLLIVEPRFHVSEKTFARTVEILSRCGFRIVRQGSSCMNRVVLVTHDPYPD